MSQHPPTKPHITILCLLGALALLLVAQSASASPGRDLVLDPNAINPFLEEKTFGAGHCAVAEGCAQPGTRQLLRFTTETRNIGDTDVMLGSPTDSNVFELDACHVHEHFGDFVEATLLDGAMQLVASSKQGFCLLDVMQFDPNANPSKVYNDCSLQGLQSGWADVYPSSLDCQWVDITDVPGGTYTLRMTVNPDGLSVLEDPNNLGNNMVEVVIPPGAGGVMPVLSPWGLLLLAALMLAVGVSFLLHAQGLDRM